MKVEWNPVTLKPMMIFEEADYVNAAFVQELLQSPGWAVLQGYFQSSKENILELGKKFSKSRTKKELCDNLFALLDGFDTAVRLPQKVVDQANLMRSQEEKKREAQREAEETKTNEYGD